MQNKDRPLKISACTTVLGADRINARDKITARLHRGYAYRLEEKYAQALTDVEQVLTDSPNWGHAHYERGMLKAHYEDYYSAVRSFDRAVSLMSDKAFVWVARGRAIYALGHDWTAVQDFTEALRLAPEFAEAYEYRGRALCREGRIDDALADWAASRRLDDEALDRQRRWTNTVAAADGSDSGSQFAAALRAFATEGCPGL